MHGCDAVLRLRRTRHLLSVSREQGSIAVTEAEFNTCFNPLEILSFLRHRFR